MWLLAVLLVLVTLALYWPATGFDFINYDDDLYVTANVPVLHGLTWQNIRWACLTPVCANWHPLTVLSHMVVCQAWGLNPWGHHFTNVLLHALNAGLVFALLHQMTAARWRSLLVAALFAFHPLHVESVAWVSERKDVLSGFFGLLALMAYARYAARGHWSEVIGQRSLVFYLLSLCFFALGLMSKPILVTVPFLMLLLDYWPLGRMEKAENRVQQPAASTTHHATRLTFHISLLLEKLPFFALAALASVVTFVVQQRAGSLSSVASLPLGVRSGNALISYCRYLGKLFWPKELAFFYPHPGQWPMARILLAGGLILGISALLVVQQRRSPFLMMGWLWFCGMLVPVIGLVQTGAQAMADRHSYLPSLGVLILAVWGAHEVTRRWRYAVLALWVVGAGVLILTLALTRQQLGYWRESETLFRHALAVTENNYSAHHNLGVALYTKGQLDEAIHQLQVTIRLTPDDADAHHHLGTAFEQQGRIDEAIRQFQAAIRLKPDYADACNNLGVALASKDQTDEAIRQFQEAIRVKPDHPLAHYNLGNALLFKGQTDEAIRQFQAVIRLKPDHADAHYNLGTALGSKGQTDDAITQYEEATRLSPGNADAHYNLGLALAAKGQTDEAIRRFEAALKVKPEYPEAHYHFGLALARKGQTAEAIRQFQEALRLKPDYADARKNLIVALAAQAASSPPSGPSTNR